MAAYRRVYDSRRRRLTAKNRDQLQTSKLGNRVWTTFTFLEVQERRCLASQGALTTVCLCVCC